MQHARTHACYHGVHLSDVPVDQWGREGYSDACAFDMGAQEFESRCSAVARGSCQPLVSHSLLAFSPSLVCRPSHLMCV